MFVQGLQIEKPESGKLNYCFSFFFCKRVMLYVYIFNTQFRYTDELLSYDYMFFYL